MALLYNPITDAFTYYTPTTPPKVEIEDPLQGLTDISDWATRVTSSGVPIVSPNTPESEAFDLSFLDMMAQTHANPQNNTEPALDTLSYKGSLSKNERFAYEYLIKNNIPKGAAAGIVGNLYHEDLANPLRTVNDSHGTKSYGVAGFNTKGELPNLLNWAKKNGINGNPNFLQQLDFIIDVIKTRPNLSILLNNKITPTEASFIWGSLFERFAGDNKKNGYLNRNDSHHKKRAARANKIFESYA